MMKQGWEIKKLGEVATYVNGYAFKPDHWTDDGVPIIRIQNLNNQDAVYNYCNMDIPKKFVVEYGDILISWSASLGVYEWLGERSYLNQHIFKVVFDKCNINKYFFKYAVSSKINEMLKNAHGATMKHIVKKDFDNTEIIYPSIAEQERIVGELDCLSGIIAAKRAQLRELDTLAQSIFYTMFGDPITNDKGWSVKQLKDVSTLINGRAYKQEELLSEGKYKVIRVGNFFTNGDYYYSDLELDDDKYCDIGDLLFAWSASFGAFIWNGGKVIYHYHIWKVLFDERKLNIQYYRYILNVMTNDFMKDVHGIGMFHLTKAGMEQYKLPIPPLSLQNEFAEKIENIERQKELITKSIKETEDLFNSRMSYYFD